MTLFDKTLQSFRSAKGADAGRQITEELVWPLGGTLDTATVLREFLRRQREGQY